MIRSLAILALGLSALFPATATLADVKFAPFPTIVRAGKLVDVINSKVLTNQCIFINEDTISKVIPCSADFGRRYPATRLIDWSAYTVLPGLIDLHTHLADAGQSAEIGRAHV